jgi:hypothetical protein
MSSQQHLGTFSPSLPNREKFIELMVSGWLIAGAIGIILSWALGDDLIGDSLGWIVAGAVGGLISGYALMQVEPSLQKKQMLLLAVGWAINLAFFEIITGAIASFVGISLSWILGWGIAGAVGGWVTGYTLAQVNSRIQRKQLLLMVFSFAAGWAIGGAVAGSLGEALSWAVGWIVAGTTHSSVILWCLREHNFDIKA